VNIRFNSSNNADNTNTSSASSIPGIIGNSVIAENNTGQSSLIAIDEDAALVSRMKSLPILTKAAGGSVPNSAREILFPNGLGPK
jgi:hypothetical protein